MKESSAVVVDGSEVSILSIGVSTDARRVATAEAYLMSNGYFREDHSNEEYQQSVHRVLLDIGGIVLVSQLLGRSRTKLEVSHRADFGERVKATGFANHVLAKGYRVRSVTPTGPGIGWVVHFDQRERLTLNSMCCRTLDLLFQADIMGGTYDGWQVSRGSTRIGATFKCPARRVPSRGSDAH